MTARKGELGSFFFMNGRGIYDKLSTSHPRQHSDYVGKRNLANSLLVVGAAPYLTFDSAIDCCY